MTTFGSRKRRSQRYLDFVFKVALKRALQGLMNDGFLNASEVDGMYVFVDEHTTATDGRYELQESLETEFKYGTTNFDFMTHFPPLFPGMRSVSVQMKDSRSSTLIRAADIVANRIYHCACVGDYSGIDGKVRYIIQP